tara:strand:- start:19813 stop:20217 length:405 start_codon:yes stop_codon:yes gene_type:complete
MKLTIENKVSNVSDLPKGEEVRFVFKGDRQFYYVISQEKSGTGRLYKGLEGQEFTNQEVSEYVFSTNRNINELDMRFRMMYTTTEIGKDVKSEGVTEIRNALIHIPVPLESWETIGLYIKNGNKLVEVLEKIVY